MPILVETGRAAYVLKKDSDAVKLLSILSEAIQVQWDYEGQYSDRRYRYYPVEKPDEIVIKTISQEQCVRCKQAALPKKPLQLEG